MYYVFVQIVLSEWRTEFIQQFSTAEILLENSRRLPFISLGSRSRRTSHTEGKKKAYVQFSYEAKCINCDIYFILKLLSKFKNNMLVN